MSEREGRPRERDREEWRLRSERTEREREKEGGTEGEMRERELVMFSHFLFLMFFLPMMYIELSFVFHHLGSRVCTFHLPSLLFHLLSPSQIRESEIHHERKV